MRGKAESGVYNKTDLFAFAFSLMQMQMQYVLHVHTLSQYDMKLEEMVDGDRLNLGVDTSKQGQCVRP